MTALSGTAFTKAERKALRALVPEIHDAEARVALADLDHDFLRWRVREIDSQALIEAIHQFPQHDARELWSRYSFLDAAEAVARGVAHRLVDESRLAPALRAKLDERIERFSGAGETSEWAGSDDEDDDEPA